MFTHLGVSISWMSTIANVWAQMQTHLCCSTTPNRTLCFLKAARKVHPSCSSWVKHKFIKKPLSSKTKFIRALPVRGTHHPSKNNIPCLVWKRRGPSARDTFTQTRLVPTLGVSAGLFCWTLPAEGRQCSAERPAEGPKVGLLGLGFFGESGFWWKWFLMKVDFYSKWFWWKWFLMKMVFDENGFWKVVFDENFFVKLTTFILILMNPHLTFFVLSHQLFQFLNSIGHTSDISYGQCPAQQGLRSSHQLRIALLEESSPGVQSITSLAVHCTLFRWSSMDKGDSVWMCWRCRVLSPLFHIWLELLFRSHVPFPWPTIPEEFQTHQHTVLTDKVPNFPPTLESGSSACRRKCLDDVLAEVVVYLGHLRVRTCCCRGQNLLWCSLVLLLHSVLWWLPLLWPPMRCSSPVTWGFWSAQQHTVALPVSAPTELAIVPLDLPWLTGLRVLQTGTVLRHHATRFSLQLNILSQIECPRINPAWDKEIVRHIQNCCGHKTRHDRRSPTAIDKATLWPNTSKNILEGLCKLRMRESEKLKTVLELYDLETHQKKLGPDFHRLKTMVKRSIEQEIRKKNFRARFGNYWEERRGQESGDKTACTKNSWRLLAIGKPTGNVWKETIVVSATILISVGKVHHQIRLRILPCSKMSENHWEPKVPGVRVPAVECLDGLARITSKELPTTHSVKDGILQNACSTKTRMVAVLGISAHSHIARLTHSRQNGPNRIMTKAPWLYWKRVIGMNENLSPMDVTIDRGNLIRVVVKSWDEIHRNVNYLMHDNWVAHFRTWRCRSLLSGRVPTCRSQSSV